MPRPLAILLLVILVAVPALAVEPPVDNGDAVLCIYTQPAASPEAETVLTDIVPGEVYPIYFVLYHAEMRSHNMGGFEFSWRVEPESATPEVLDIEFGIEYGFCYNFGTPFDLLVGYSQRDPHAPEEPFLLFTASIMFTSVPENAAVYLGPSSLESIPGEMVYADFVFPEELWVMVPNNADQVQDQPVFHFAGVVATESRSLSAVKGLFD